MNVESPDPPVYLVLGASGGIGSSLARNLQHRGARLVLAARREERLRRLAGKTGGDASPLDATHPGEVERCAQQAIETHPLGRLGRPEDVASVAAWLLGPESDWVTGQVFGVDGGLATLKTRGS